jgi:hypothetical protein
MAGRWGPLAEGVRPGRGTTGHLLNTGKIQVGGGTAAAWTLFLREFRGGTASILPADIRPLISKEREYILFWSRLSSHFGHRWIKWKCQRGDMSLTNRERTLARQVLRQLMLKVGAAAHRDRNAHPASPTVRSSNLVLHLKISSCTLSRDQRGLVPLELDRND